MSNLIAPPQTIPRSSIIVADRGRTQLFGIEELSESIEGVGLILPIILDPAEDNTFRLVDGGRRLAALDLLFDEGSLPPFLYHAATSEVGRPGFLLKKEQGTNLSNLILEIRANLDRSDMDWRDEVRMIVRAWRLAKAEAHAEQEVLLMRDFGSMLGCGYADLKIANKIYDHFIANPKLYEDVDSLSGTLGILLRTGANEVARIAVTRTLAVAPVAALGAFAAPQAIIPVADDSSPRPDLAIVGAGTSPAAQITLAEHSIALSECFFNTDAYQFLADAPPGFCDHVICDPDYALGADVLNAHPNNRPGVMLDGVNQSSPEESLAQLYRLFPLVFRALPEHGFFIFFYALDHHEKLLAATAAAGFAVQRWPLIWNKMDFRGRSNTAPNHNFPKSTEFAMICRKPGTVLNRVQNSSVFTTTANTVVKDLGHTFAKPYDLWTWLYKAVSRPGQIVFDPFVGTGSSAIAAIRYGLRPIGTEIDKNLYANLLVNIQLEYHKLLGPNVKFK